MGKPHPIELRARVVAYVEEGNSHRAAARHFRVSVRFVNDMVKLKRETGSLDPKRQGNGGWSKLNGLADWMRARLAERGELTLDELVREIEAVHGLKVHRASVGRFLHRQKLSHKKNSAGCRARAAGRGRGAGSLGRVPPAVHAQPPGTAVVSR